MFDIGWPELMVVMVIALIVIGPKDLPAAIRTVTMILRKVRGMAAEFQSGLDEIAREAGVDEINRSVDEVVTFDPKEALESIGELDDGEFSLDDEIDPTHGNSILDPAAQSQMFNDDPDAVAADREDAVNEAGEDDVSTAANEDEPAPRPAASAAAKASGSS